jgi:hypothetical protein
MNYVHQMDYSRYLLIEIVVLDYIGIFVSSLLAFVVLNEQILNKIYEQDDQRIV